MDKDKPLESLGLVPGAASQAEKLPQEANPETKRLFTRSERAGALRATGEDKRCPVCTRRMTLTEAGRWVCVNDTCKE